MDIAERTGAEPSVAEKTRKTPAGGALWRPGEFSLRDAWFPVAHAFQVGERPIRRTVHSQPYYLWRDHGQLRAAEFHPAELEARRKAATAFTGGTGEYPVVELYGHAWVWYGDPDHATPELVPDIPFLPRNRAQPRYATETNFFHCTYELVLENILDMTHIDYVHGNVAGPPDSESDVITFESTSETVTMLRTVKKKKTSQYQREVLGITEPYQDQHMLTHVFIRTGMCFLHSRYSAAPSMPLMQTNTPESRTLTRANAARGIQQCRDPIYRREWPKTGWMVAAQDESVLNPQNPRYLEQPEALDCSSRFDAAGIHYRARHNALVERQKTGDFSYLPDSQGLDMVEILGVKRVN